MDVLYVLGKGSKYNDAELRFSLRSMQKYLTGVDRVFLVGERPAFIKNVEYLPFRDSYSIADINIYLKIKHACENGISDKFLFMNDDHFFLDYFDTEKFPNFAEGTIDEYLKRRGGALNDYTRRVKRAAPGDSPFFDVHTPIVYEREKFLAMKYDMVNGQTIKSLYGYTYKLEPTPFKDLKIFSQQDLIVHSKTPIFSTRPRITAGLWRAIEEAYPLSSKYE